MTEQKVYGYRWVVLVVYMFASAVSQFFWLNFAAVETFMEERLGITPMEGGWLALVFPLMSIIFSIPFGILIDRKGIRWGIGSGVLLLGIFGCLRLINPDTYLLLLISQIGAGAGTACILNGTTKIAVTWFPEKEEATAVSLGTVAMFLGMMIGLGVTPMLLTDLGYFNMLLTYSLLGVLAVVLFFVLVKERPPTPARLTAATTEFTDMKQWRGLRDILKMPSFVLLSIIFLIGTGCFNGIATWIEKFLNESHGIPLTEVGYVSGIMILGAIIGCIVMPLISDKLMKRKPFLFTALVGGVIFIVLMLFPFGFTGSLINSFLLGFFMISALPILMTLSVEYAGERYAGISLGWLWLLGNACAVAVVPAMEMLRDATGQFTLAMLLLAVLLIVAIILTFMLKEPRLGEKK